MSRLDLAECKNRIDHALRDVRDAKLEYWNAIDRYLRARLTKKELEEVVFRCLPQHLNLHNEFFIVLLHNAQCPQLPPAFDSEDTIRKKKRDEAVRRRKLRASIDNISSVTATINSKLPLGLRRLTAPHVPMSSMGPRALLTHPHIARSLMSPYMFESNRLLRRSAPIAAVQTPRLTPAAKRRRLSHAASALHLAQSNVPVEEDALAPILQCEPGSVSMSNSWMRDAVRGGVANDLPDHSSIKSRLLEIGRQTSSAVNVPDITADIVTDAVDVYLRSVLSAIIDAATSRRNGLPQPGSRFALPARLLFQPTDLSESTQTESSSNASAIAPPPIPDLSRDLLSFLSPAESTSSHSHTSNSVSVGTDDANSIIPHKQNAPPFVRFFPAVSSMLVAASNEHQFDASAQTSHVSIPERASRRVELDCPPGEHEVMEWTLMPRDNGDGRLNDDAVRVSFGHQVLLREDCLAAIHSRPELAGRSLLRMLEKLG